MIQIQMYNNTLCKHTIMIRCPRDLYALTRKYCVRVCCFETLILQDHVRFICHFEYKCISYCLSRSVLYIHIYINKAYTY